MKKRKRKGKWRQHKVGQKRDKKILQKGENKGSVKLVKRRQKKTALKKGEYNTWTSENIMNIFHWKKTE